VRGRRHGRDNENEKRQNHHARLDDFLHRAMFVAYVEQAFGKEERRGRDNRERLNTLSMKDED
jgi:hypothetical protein